VPRSRPTPLPRAYLARKLANLLPTTDGGVLRTIGDAIDYMTALPKQRELRQTWQNACRLILARADVAEISRALELALFTDVKLDLRAIGQMRKRASA
jgi:hypothetical protein